MRRRQSESQRVVQLRSLELLAGLEERELAKVSTLSTLVELPAGHALCGEGEPGRECFIVASGEASVSRDGSEVARVGTGQILGEMALLGPGHVRNATVTALTPMWVLVLNPREFSTLTSIRRIAGRVRSGVSARTATAE
jgi:CRP-like cAMP-binding protein